MNLTECEDSVIYNSKCSFWVYDCLSLWEILISIFHIVLTFYRQNAEWIHCRNNQQRNQ